MAELLGRMRGKIRALHDGISTEDAYVLRARQSLVFHGKTHPREMGEKGVQPAVE